MDSIQVMLHLKVFKNHLILLLNDDPYQRELKSLQRKKTIAIKTTKVYMMGAISTISTLIFGIRYRSTITVVGCYSEVSSLSLAYIT